MSCHIELGLPCSAPISSWAVWRRLRTSHLHPEKVFFRFVVPSSSHFDLEWIVRGVSYSPFSLKIVTIQSIKSRIWDTIDDWYINNLAKNQVSAVFHSRVICRSVSPKFIELCMETPCLWPSEGHKHGGRKVTVTSVTEFCFWNEKVLL